MVDLSGRLHGSDGRDYQVEIHPVDAAPTTVTVSASPAGPQAAGTVITLTATVSPPNAAGSVSFSGIGDTTAVTVTNGVAVKNISPSAGDLTIGATFTPADPVAFVGSTAAPLSYTVTSAATVLSASSYTPTTTWEWTYGSLLASGGVTATDSADQYATASYSGLSTTDLNIGFEMRSGSTPGDGILVVINKNVGVRIEAPGISPVDITATVATSGTLRVEVAGSGASTTVKAFVNGAQLGSTATIDPSPAPTAKGVRPAAWMSATGPALSSLTAGSLGAPTPPTSVPAAPTLAGLAGNGTASLSWGSVPTATSYDVYQGTTKIASTAQTNLTVTGLTNGTAYSFTVKAVNSVGASAASNAVSVTPAVPPVSTFHLGAAGEGVPNGQLNAWHAQHKIDFAGTWSDIQPVDFSNLTGDYAGWTGYLDVAVGGIWKSSGDSWAAAAAGSYDSRWTARLNALKAAWGSKDPTKLLIRFAHEHNGNWFDWHVTSGEATDFANAWARWANILHTVIPGAKAVWSPANQSSGGHASPSACYPPSGVDMIGVDMYNQYPHVTSAADVASTWINATYTAEWWRQFAEARGVPMYFAEIGNPALDGGGGAGGGDAPEFFKGLHAWGKAHAGSGAGQVFGMVWFNISSGYVAHFRFAVGGSSADPLQPQFAEAFRTSTV